MLLVDVPENASPQPVMVTGAVVTATEPANLEAPASPLGSWASLSATPTSWRAPECVRREPDGCRQYDGKISGSASSADAVRTLRGTLMAGGYVVSSDTCPATGPVETSCTIAVRRFRTLGSFDGVVMLFRVSPDGTDGFAVTMKAEPYPE